MIVKNYQKPIKDILELSDRVEYNGSMRLFIN